MRRILTALALVALAAGFGLAVRGGPAAATESAAPSGQGTVLRVGWMEKPDNLNPFIGIQTTSWLLWRLNYDRLVEYDPDSLKPVPGLATSWSVSKDGKTWTFKLRKGVTWQDGVPFTADDVVFTYDLIIKTPMYSYTPYTDGIKSVKAIDDDTVQFTTFKPKANMLQMWVTIEPKHIWSKISPKQAANSFPNNPPIIGTGPFQVVEWKRGEYVRLKANPNYWGGAPKVDEILFVIYTNAFTMAQDLKNGTIQYGTVDAAAFKSFQSTSGMTAHLATEDSYDDLGFNCYAKASSKGNPVLRDPAFRRALAWAIDHEKITRVAYDGDAVPATSILPEKFFSRPLDYHWQPPPDQQYHYDPAKAEQLLDEAGYRDTNGDGIRDYHGKPIRLRLWTISEKPEYDLEGKLIAGWLKDIGLGITYQVMDEGALNDRVYNYEHGKYAPDFDLFVWGWDGDFDPSFLLSVLLTNQIENWSDTCWSNAEYDRLFNEQATTLDPTMRRDIVWRMQQIIYEECPYIPLVYLETRDVYNTGRWQGWVRQPMDGSVDNRYTYLRVHPVEASASGGGGIGAGLWVIIGVAAAVVVVVGVVVIQRRRRRTQAEEV